MIKPKYKIIFTDSFDSKYTCGKCDMQGCSPAQCGWLEKSLTKRCIYFKKVN